MVKQYNSITLAEMGGFVKCGRFGTLFLLSGCAIIKVLRIIRETTVLYENRGHTKFFDSGSY